MDLFWGVIEQYNRMRYAYDAINDAHIFITIIVVCGITCFFGFLLTGQLFQLVS